MTLVSPDAARHQIHIRLEQLRSRSCADLSTLPPFSIEEIAFGAELWSVTTYGNLEENEVRIVVQLVRRNPI